MHRLTRKPMAVALVLSCMTATACATPPAPAPAAAAPKAKAPAPQPPAEPHAPGHIARADLDALLPRGLTWLLKVTWPEDIVRDGKFFGWRVLALPEAWGSAYLKPGDIVTSVNGKSLKTPEDLWAAWTGLATASEVRIAYERDGRPGEVTLPIDGPPSKDLAEKLESAPPGPPPTPTMNPRRKTTVVIEEDTSLE